jgi:WD40 repeat protein
MTLSGHLDVVQCIAFSADGKLASGSPDQNINLWSIQVFWTNTGAGYS